MDESTVAQRRNNFLAAIVLLVVVFLAAIPLPWLTLSHGDEVKTLTGWDGTLDLMGVAKLPVWWLLGLSAAATTIIGLNYARVTSIPFLLPLFAILGTGVYYAWPLLAGYDAESKVSIAGGVGLFMALAATGATFCLGLLRPLPTPIWQSVHTLQPPVRTRPAPSLRRPARRY